MKTNLKQLSEKELILFVENLGQKPYRAKQILNWIYKKLATSFDEMTDLPVSLREILKKTAYISNINLLKRQISKDGTQKFLFGLEDGETIESVLIPDKKRLTLCISSQVGCAMGCRFCMTGRLGLKRNLEAYEIVDQIIAVSRLIAQKSIIPPHPLKSPHPPFKNPLSPFIKGGCRGIIGGQAGIIGDRENLGISNIVFMGMGEPLHNFEEVIEALWRMTGLMGFSKRKITVSTAGIVPKISELAEKGPNINLAISLNATTDEVRNKIMPINKKNPLKELINACRRFPLPPRRRITFEYVLLDGINDSGDDALRLVKLLKGINSKINLIPYNPISGETLFKRTEDMKILAFQKILVDAGMTAIIRKSKGQDIMAACGQLKAGYLRN